MVRHLTQIKTIFPEALDFDYVKVAKTRNSVCDFALVITLLHVHDPPFVQIKLLSFLYDKQIDSVIKM